MTHDPHTLLSSDAELIRRALAGDRNAAGRLSERYRREVQTVAYRALGNADDALDVTQEALVYAHQNLAALRDTGRLSGWLRHLTLSLCADYRRRRSTCHLGIPLAHLSEAGAESDHSLRITVHQAVAHLSEEQRTTLLLHYVGGWSLVEVADIMAIPLNTVRSRLMAGKRYLRADLQTLFPAPVFRKGASFSMPTRTSVSGDALDRTFSLSEAHTEAITAVFPGSRIVSVQDLPEPWMPFGPRVRLVLPDGADKTVDFRSGMDDTKIQIAAALKELGIPGPQILHPMPGENICLCELPRGENLSLWVMGGTPHRIRIATEKAFEGIDRLQGITEGLLAHPVAPLLPRRTLTDEVSILTDDDKWNAEPWMAEEGKARADWLRNPWFQSALTKVSAAAADIRTPLVYTDYAHFFPQGYRIQPDDGRFDEPLGWPGDKRYETNPLVEFVYLFGHIGDPLLGLSMVWLYDCYPFVHTGFVEEFLWRRDVSRREFGPRLALKGLQIIARDLTIARPAEGTAHWDGLHGWVEKALEWM